MLSFLGGARIREKPYFRETCILIYPLIKTQLICTEHKQVTVEAIDSPFANVLVESEQVANSSKLAGCGHQKFSEIPRDFRALPKISVNFPKI